jgi:uncharacterized protein (TIGR02265 family)
MMRVTVSTAYPQDPSLDLVHARSVLGLPERLSASPPWAQVRGFLFKMTADAVERQGRAAVEMQRKLLPAPSRWFFRMYSVREYLEELAAAAAVVDPKDPASALRHIWARTPGYAPLFNASRFLGLLGADVTSVAGWLEGHRSLFANYGRWRLERRSTSYFIMHYFEECIWIDSAHRGGMEGILDACGVKGSVEVELDSPFEGRLHVRWHPR